MMNTLIAWIAGSPLIIGIASIVFGAGWGLGGFCPGPGVVALGMGLWPPVVFVAGLIGGTLIFRGLQSRQPQPASSGAASTQ